MFYRSTDVYAWNEELNVMNGPLCVVEHLMVRLKAEDATLVRNPDATDLKKKKKLSIPTWMFFCLFKIENKHYSFLDTWMEQLSKLSHV